MTRALWGKAKLEVYALKDEILTLKSEGSTIEEIYRAVRPITRRLSNWAGSTPIWHGSGICFAWL